MRDEILQTLLDNEFNWRKRELIELFKLLNYESSNNLVLEKSFLLLLYSHWEGCIKKVSKIYLKYISNKKPLIKEINKCFLSMIIKGKIKECYNSHQGINLTNEISFINKFTTLYEAGVFKLNRFNINDDRDKSLISTSDNLNSNVLESILNLLGLNFYDAINMRSKYIDIYLLENRNIISHGSSFVNEDREFSLDKKNLKELAMIIYEVTKLIIDDIKNYVKEEYYLIANQEQLNAYILKREEYIEDKIEFIKYRLARYNAGQ